MNNVELFINIDKNFIPTLEKYGKEQLIGAIITCLTTGETKSFTKEESRAKIKKIGSQNIKKALLLNILKLDAHFGIAKLTSKDTFSKNYNKHTVDETNLRILQVLKLSNNPKFNGKAIKEADYIISNEANALLNVIKSFIESRYINNYKNKLDSPIYDLEYLNIIDNINKYFKNNLSV